MMGLGIDGGGDEVDLGEVREAGGETARVKELEGVAKAAVEGELLVAETQIKIPAKPRMRRSYAKMVVAREEDGVKGILEDRSMDSGFDAIDADKLEGEPTFAKVKNETEETPLHEASRVGELDIVKQLLDDCLCVAYMLNKDRESAFFIACSCEHSEVAWQFCSRMDFLA
ncbi:hypothetical protein AAC387_Pa03g1360 [Persea americana]